MTSPSAPAAIQKAIATSKALQYKPKSRFVAFVLWPLWPLLDPHTGRPSGPRCMAWAIYFAFLRDHPIPAMVCALLMSIMFGYSMFKEVMGKSTLNLSSTDAVSLKHEFTEHVDRRTFTYTTDGVPATSLPPAPAAKTPAGDD